MSNPDAGKMAANQKLRCSILTMTVKYHQPKCIYGFDMYPEGAPPGNKYQSVQVKFQ